LNVNLPPLTATISVPIYNEVFKYTFLARLALLPKSYVAFDSGKICPELEICHLSVPLVSNTTRPSAPPSITSTLELPS